MKEELLKGLTEEQIAKLKECKSQEEMLQLAKTEGVELTDDQLAAVSGGGCGKVYRCPKCGNWCDDIYTYTNDPDVHYAQCDKCHYEFMVNW